MQDLPAQKDPGFHPPVANAPVHQDQHRDLQQRLARCNEEADIVATEAADMHELYIIAKMVRQVPWSSGQVSLQQKPQMFVHLAATAQLRNSWCACSMCRVKSMC
ncbi:hypothetical protein ABBQ38_013076 [Trebouxia sp. C0009 RCD-2024]